MKIRVAIALFALACGTETSSISSDVGSSGSDAQSPTEDGSEAPPDVSPGPGADVESADLVSPPEDTAPDAGPDVPAPKCDEDGAPCELDGDPCTVEVCGGGKCLLTNGVESCAADAAKDPCWTFKCTTGKGCERSVFASGIACDDANACTVGDRCQPGVKACLGDGIPVDDQNPCTADTCLEGTISHSNIDGAPCTGGLCDGGACVPNGCTPVDGGWSVWQWTSCSAPCGGGTRDGTRTCTAPAPTCGGASCVGEPTSTETCNTQECLPLTEVTACPAGLPFGPNPTCLTLPPSQPYSKLVNSSKNADSYGVKLVAGPGGSVAALYAEQEWFERLASDGTVLQAPVSLPAKNPTVAPGALGDSGFPAFYGPALGFDGTNYAVARPAKELGNVHVYTVDGTGTLVDGPITIQGPPGSMSGDRGPAIQWTGDAWLVAWAIYSPDGVVVSRVLGDLVVDPSFGDLGTLFVEGASRHPEIAVSSDGAVAAMVSGETTFHLALFDAVSGGLIATTPGGCQGGAGSYNGDGHDIAWNDALGEFGLIHTTQGDGLCDVTYTSVTATLIRLTPNGEWIGSPLPVLCGYPIGAGYRGGVAAWPDGRYAVGMQRHHSEPFCVDPFPNGSKGISSFDLVTVNTGTQAIDTWRTKSGTTSVYSQSDLVFTGTHMVGMSPRGIGGATAGYVFEAP